MNGVDMTERQLLNLKPHAILRAGKRKYRVTRIQFADTITVNVVPERDWDNYLKQFKLATPVEEHDFKTEAEVQNVPEPQILEWRFNLKGKNFGELGRGHLDLIDEVSV